MGNALVLPFSEIAEDMLPLVGGKGLNLGLMTRAGLPVPDGVCVTTEAYRRVAENAGLGPVLEELATAGPDDDLARLAGQARSLVRTAEVPADIAAAVKETAGHGLVAVRSSATAEDLPTASFAGQQDTYLNVLGPEAVLQAVRDCWASLWTDRAVAYRAANGIDHAAVRLCVVVQQMVPAEVAGVMFTANPVTGRRHETVIDAAPGLGESVVSGAVNPDHFVVDTATGRITERRIADRTTLIRGLPEGGTEQIAASAGGGPCLTDEQLTALAELGARVEEHYGAPQDTEWAIDADGTLWLTQARPITTLYPVPPSDLPGLRVYLSVNVAQGVFRPFTPMGLEAFRRLTRQGSAAGTTQNLAGAMRAPGLAVAGGRIFADVTGAVRSGIGRDVLPRLLDFGEARSATVVRSLLDDPRLRPLPVSPGAVLRALGQSARGGHRVPLQIAQALADPAAALRRAQRIRDGLGRLLPLPADATAQMRLDHVERVLGREAMPLVYATVPDFLAGYLMLGLARLLLPDRADRARLQNVLRSLPHNPTTEMDLALWQAATRIKADPEAAKLLRDTPAEDLARSALPATVRTEVDAFLAEYGHRAVAEIDIGMPRWSDDPAHILGVLANYLRLDDPALAPDALFAKGAEEADRTAAELAAGAGGVRGSVIRFALDRTRQLAGLREVPKFNMIRIFAGLRVHLTAVGAELTTRGVLDRPEDIYFTTLAEARDGLRGTDLKPVVAQHRAEYERELARRHIPRVLLSDGTEPEAVGLPAGAGASSAAAAPGALTGTPASAGTVTGTARVIHDPTGAHLNPGEILVCPSTDPGWTPLFLTAGGLVMEMGGAISHGAVVAREYGIPAVVGVAGATERIKDGSRISVDGAAGTVEQDAGQDS